MLLSGQSDLVVALCGDKDADQPVIEMATAICEHEDVHVHFVSVVRPVANVAHIGSMAPLSAAISAGEIAAENVDDAIVQRTREINKVVGNCGSRPKKFSIEVKSGLVDEELIKAAEEHDAALLIVGHTERTWFEELISPDLASQVVKKSKRAVLVIPIEV